MSSGGDTKPPDPGTGGTRVAPLATPVDLARVVVKPALPELPSVSLAQATHTSHLTGLPARVQQTAAAAPPAALTGTVISAAPASQNTGSAIFTPSSHLIVPAASKTASLRPPIRPLHPTPVVGPGVQKMITPTGVSPVSVKATPTVVQHVSRAPVVPMQQQQSGSAKRPAAANAATGATVAPNASLIRAPQFSSHVPRGPATVASITAGPKTAVATPIIRQTGTGGQNVVLAPTIPVGATRTTQGATLTATRSFAPVTMVEVAKPGVSVGVSQGGQQLHLGLQPSITIESSVARASGTSHKTQTVYAPAIFQPVVSGAGGGDKIAPTTATFFKTTSPAVHQGAQFTKGGTTFTPITTSQPQAVVQAAQAGVAPVVSIAGGVVPGVAAGTQAVTITSKVSVVTSAAAGQQHFGKVTPQPVFVANNKAGGVSNVVITTSQRPVRNVTTTQVTTAVTNASNLSIPMAKVYQQQPLTVSTQSADLEGQPQPIGFMTATGPRLQLPVISVGGQGVGAVQGAAPPGAVVLAGPESRAGATAQYAMPPGAYLTYETYPAYFGGQSGTSTPVHLTTATIPGVRAVSPRAPFSAPRPLMVTVDTKVHPAPNAQTGVISVTANKTGSVHPSTPTPTPSSTMTVGVPSTTIETSGGVTVTPVEVPTSSTTRIVTSEPVVGGSGAKLTTAAEHTNKLMEKVITQSLNTPVNPPTAPLPLSLSIAPASVSALSGAAITSVSVTPAAAAAAVVAAPGSTGSPSISSPSRPSILRKRPATLPDQCLPSPSISSSRKETSKDDSASSTVVSVKQESMEDNNNTSVNIIQSTGGGESQHTTVQHHQHAQITGLGGQNGQVASPRKKPRKQLLQMAEGETANVICTGAITTKRKENGRGETLVEREPAGSPGAGKHPPQQQRPQLFGAQFQPNWKARLNHFVHHSDVRSRDDKRPTVNELANQKCAAQRAHGWKLYHIKGQVEEVETIESDVFQRFSKILDEFENSTNHRPSEGSGTSHLSPEDEKMFNKITDLIKGNLQRSKIMQDQVGEVKKQLVKVLDHKPRVLDVIGKHVSKRPLKKREKL